MLPVPRETPGKDMNAYKEAAVAKTDAEIKAEAAEVQRKAADIAEAARKVEQHEAAEMSAKSAAAVKVAALATANMIGETICFPMTPHPAIVEQQFAKQALMSLLPADSSKDAEAVQRNPHLAKLARVASRTPWSEYEGAPVSVLVAEPRYLSATAQMLLDAFLSR